MLGNYQGGGGGSKPTGVQSKTLADHKIGPGGVGPYGYTTDAAARWVGGADLGTGTRRTVLATGTVEDGTHEGRVLQRGLWLLDANGMGQVGGSFREWGRSRRPLIL